MEQAFGADSDSVPVPADKTKILIVKPLRCLVPIFPSPQDPSAPPSSQYASVPPTGPFPPGAAPFFPFFASNVSQKQSNEPQPPHPRPYTIPSPVPLNSFRTPGSDVKNGDIGTSKKSIRSRMYVDEDGYSQSDGYDNSFGKDMETGSEVDDKRRVTRKKVKSTIAVSNSDIDIDSFVTHLLESFNLLDVDSFRQCDSDKELADRVLMVYNLLRRKITQLDDTKEGMTGSAKRPDLRAGTICMSKGARANIKKRVGPVPGVEIGDIFFFRFEMCLVGLHAPSMAGIDYMSVKFSGAEEPVAVSIVSAGGYEDEGDDGDVLIYSGQGGVSSRGKPQSDQLLIRGNLALEKSLHRGNEVRVIRGLKDYQHTTGKVYVYDGLYRIHESWIEKGKSGCNVFKYKLVRIAGQPSAFTLWKSIQQWKDVGNGGGITRTGVILPDLTSGAEKVPVSLVNDVDNEKGPAYFTYSRSLKYRNPFPSTQSLSCSCTNGCQPGYNCPCIEKNGGYIPYTPLGVLLSHNTLIHECGSSCRCPPNCRNRISQAGLKLRLEVFKTRDRGWGLRSWDPIRSGAFICEYAGVVIEENGIDYDDNYVFDATRSFDAVETSPRDEAAKFPYPLVISAKNEGNVGRFMNHSCSPNVYWQPVIRENQYESLIKVGPVGKIVCVGRRGAKGLFASGLHKVYMDFAYQMAPFCKRRSCSL
ncbi:unnamed protein product [Lactuca saligna]|uniref:Histone-lysine N-methyltransferase n=1 Tax=Lactuca saligna TaxID=75948 RepID=A0AA36EQ12_LACSI|nr:unnamed protein product [Lactuca saligna]